jgi:hypothetical protein
MLKRFSIILGKQANRRSSAGAAFCDPLKELVIPRSMVLNQI